MRVLPALALSASLALGACTYPDGTTDWGSTAALGIGAALGREGEVDAVIGAALGNQTLRAVERIDAELAPPAPLRKLFLQLHVEQVMAGISLVAPEVECARKADRQVGVDLDQAVIAALIIIIAAPAFPGDEFEAKAFARRHRNMRRTASPTPCDCSLEHLLQPILGDGEAVEIALHPLP